MSVCVCVEEGTWQLQTKELRLTIKVQVEDLKLAKEKLRGGLRSLFFWHMPCGFLNIIHGHTKLST